MKVPKFIIDMKQPPRSMKHGYRKSATQTHGDSIDRAGAGEPIRTRLPAATWRALYHGVPITRIATIPIMPFPDPPGAASDHLKQTQERTIQQMQMLMFNSWNIIDDLIPKPPELPHSGFRAGEIIGWRLWWVNKDGRLCSFVKNEIFWEPGIPMTGDINKCVHISMRSPDRFGGVYSFNNLEAVMNEFHGILPDLKHGPPAPGHIVGIILGTVKLWGEVVEHEKGYRASFAKPEEFLETYYWGNGPSRDPQELYFGPKPAIDSSRWTG